MCCSQRHIGKIDWLMAHTDCLVCLVRTVSGHPKNALVKGNASSWHITKLKQSTSLDICGCSTVILKVSGVKVYLRRSQNNRAHAVTVCIGLWRHRPMHAPHRLMHACTACIAPWCHRPMHAVTAWAVLFWFCLGYTFISSYFGNSYFWGTYFSARFQFFENVNLRWRGGRALPSPLDYME